MFLKERDGTEATAAAALLVVGDDEGAEPEAVDHPALTDMSPVSINPADFALIRVNGGTRVFSEPSGRGTRRYCFEELGRRGDALPTDRAAGDTLFLEFVLLCMG